MYIFFYKKLNIIIMEGQNFDAYVSYFYSLKNFYIQNKNDQQTIQQLFLSLQCINSENLTLVSIKPGQILAAKDESSDLWYRAKVLNAEGTAFKVEFIDYGHIELSSSFKKLPEELANYSVMAYHCMLDNVDDEEYIITSNSDIYNVVLEFITSIEVDLTFLNDKQPYLMNMKWDKRDIKICLDNIISYGITIKTHELLKKVVHPGAQMQINLIYTHSINEFYVETEDSKEIKKKIEFEIVNRIIWKPVIEYTIGKMVIARSETDNQWYRVRIIDTFKDDKCNCYFVDYGIKDYCSEFYEASGYLESAPPCIKRCLLHMPNMKKRRKELFYYLSKSFVNEMQYSTDKKFIITIIKTGEPYKVELFVDGLNVAKIIEPKPVIINKVAHINVITVQLNTPMRIFFLNELSKTKTLNIVPEPSLGKIYGALVNDQFYRVELQAKLKEYMCVTMIDMCNNIIRVCELYELPPIMQNNESMVMLCRLGLNEIHFSKTKLKQLCNNGNTEFTMIVLEHDDANGHLIRLFLNNKDVAKLIRYN